MDGGVCGAVRWGGVPSVRRWGSLVCGGGGGVEVEPVHRGGRPGRGTASGTGGRRVDWLAATGTVTPWRVGPPAGAPWRCSLSGCGAGGRRPPNGSERGERGGWAGAAACRSKCGVVVAGPWEDDGGSLLSRLLGPDDRGGSHVPLPQWTGGRSHPRSISVVGHSCWQPPSQSMFG
jgi:hypothetical protein